MIDTIVIVILAFVLVVSVTCMVHYIRELQRRNDNQREIIDSYAHSFDAEREKWNARNRLAVLGCGAQVRFFNPSEIMHLSRGRLDEQLEPFRNGGVFIDCNPSCPMRETCSLLKKLGQHSLAKGFSLAASTPGATLRADDDDGQWKLRLVRHGDKWLIDVVVDGIVVNCQHKSLFVVPPLLQVLKHCPEDNRDK